jgi:hypothetical protein
VWLVVLFSDQLDLQVDEFGVGLFLGFVQLAEGLELIQGVVEFAQASQQFTCEVASDLALVGLLLFVVDDVAADVPRSRQVYFYPVLAGVLENGAAGYRFQYFPDYCRVFRIDEEDHFTRLLKTCTTETIGGVTVREIPS